MHGPSGGSVEPVSSGEVAFAVCFYFFSITTLTFFNKWFLSINSLHFHFPLTVTATHQFFVFLFTWSTENLFLAKLAGPIDKNWRYLYQIGPIGVLCALDWGVGNLSLKLISVSLYEMIKSATPLFVLAFSLALRLQSPATLLFAAIILIAIGTYLSVCGLGGMATLYTATFPLFGATLCLSSSLFAGGRSVFTQLVMQKWIDPNTGKSKINSMTAMFFVSPMTALSFLPAIWYLEGTGLSLWWSTATSDSVKWVFIELFLSAGIAFCVTISGFLLTKKTSALTYSVVQIAERVFIVSLAMITFGDHVGFWNAFGFGTTLSGIALYNWYKLRTKHHASILHHDDSRQRTGYSPTTTLDRRSNWTSAAAYIGVDYKPRTPGVAPEASPTTWTPVAGNSKYGATDFPVKPAAKS